MKRKSFIKLNIQFVLQEEEYIQDVTENEYMQQYVRKDNEHKDSRKQQKQNNGFVVQGAPWEAPPDTKVIIHYQLLT